MTLEITEVQLWGLAVFVLGFALGVIKRQQVYIYVNPDNGDDKTGERGNKGRPFRTLAAAVKVFQTNDVINMKDLQATDLSDLLDKR